jgi:hypothetical protein
MRCNEIRPSASRDISHAGQQSGGQAEESTPVTQGKYPKQSGVDDLLAGCSGEEEVA